MNIDFNNFFGENDHLLEIKSRNLFSYGLLFSNQIFHTLLRDVYNFIHNIPFPDVILSFVFMGSQENAFG